MKIGIPTIGNRGLEEIVSEHFGRAPTFTIFDDETGAVIVIENRSEHMGGTGKPPEPLAREGIEVMLCSGLGPRAIDMFESLGIEVYVGANGTVENALQLWKNGQLQMATRENACKNHRH